jgi:hypothetical protein
LTRDPDPALTGVRGWRMGGAGERPPVRQRVLAPSIGAPRQVGAGVPARLVRFLAEGPQ